MIAVLQFFKRQPREGNKNILNSTINVSLKFSHKLFFCIPSHILNAQWECFIQIFIQMNKIFIPNFYPNISHRNFFLKKEELYSRTK